VTGECASVLKQRPVTRVRVDDELGVGEMLAEGERVDGGNHDVVTPIGHKGSPPDFSQAAIAASWCPAAPSVAETKNEAIHAALKTGELAKEG
jgi:hypothetical protein